MDKKDLIIYLISIIAIAALGFSIYSFASLKNLEKEITKINYDIKEISSVVDQFKPLAPKMKLFTTFLDRFEQILGGMPK